MGEMSIIGYAQRTAEIYQETLAEVTKILEEKPSPDQLRPKLRELKDSAVAQLIVIGSAREAMSDADKKAFEQEASRLVRNTSMSLFQRYTTAQKHYISLDPTLYNSISEFNIITQYANFDLLRTQKPKEYAELVEDQVEVE